MRAWVPSRHANKHVESARYDHRQHQKLFSTVHVQAGTEPPLDTYKASFLAHYSHCAKSFLYCVDPVVTTTLPFMPPLTPLIGIIAWIPFYYIKVEATNQPNYGRYPPNIPPPKMGFDPNNYSQIYILAVGQPGYADDPCLDEPCFIVSPEYSSDRLCATVTDLERFVPEIREIGKKVLKDYWKWRAVDLEGHPLPEYQSYYDTYLYVEPTLYNPLSGDLTREGLYRMVKRLD
ncbi:uncharacterized protein BDZ99DRAFT_457286 [Mytilinidion resinicola]|uniref:Uncharacterized protein n=1 Tax=Mytilinidion resinicola TaxID=574789 RepID=A0A6A6Z8W1_9PEZI|nr:uncharacterized protein BDZ99DRAFT_457286 [Mytilinidion resinicola]KAF2817561.1 hypothetical protein BDZ99DRAFT_457286 [Mytilinidion resinicola]